MVINVAKEFGSNLGGRYIKDGRYSAEEFRLKYLEPCLIETIKSADDLTIIFDGTNNLTKEFLEEAFGGLVHSGFSVDDILLNISIVNRPDPGIANDIICYITEAESYMKGSKKI